MITVSLSRGFQLPVSRISTIDMVWNQLKLDPGIGTIIQNSIMGTIAHTALEVMREN